MKLITQICEHGKTTVSGGKLTGNCKACDRNSEVNDAFFIPNTTPFFNRGLGCVTNGTRGAEKAAKEISKRTGQNLIPLGGQPIEKVFKKEKKDEITPILQDGMKKLRAQQIKNGEL